MGFVLPTVIDDGKTSLSELLPGDTFIFREDKSVYIFVEELSDTKHPYKCVNIDKFGITLFQDSEVIPCTIIVKEILKR